MRWQRWLGLAGVVGIAATGVVVVRAERARRAYTPEEIRDRLHARLDGPTPDGDNRLRSA
jgi:hypothetical protein